MSTSGSSNGVVLVQATIEKSGGAIISLRFCEINCGELQFLDIGCIIRKMGCIIRTKPLVFSQLYFTL